MKTCTTCGQTINEVVIIDGLPYGTTCAQNKLGIRQFPNWFKGGDWDSANAKHEAEQKNIADVHAESRHITAAAWAEWSELSAAAERQRNRNEWAHTFIRSIISQLGYYTTIAQPNFDTMEKAESGWLPSSGSFPYLYHEPKKISQLSAKQQQILNKYL